MSIAGRLSDLDTGRPTECFIGDWGIKTPLTDLSRSIREGVDYGEEVKAVLKPLLYKYLMFYDGLGREVYILQGV
jgi:hypothetical protein